MGPDRVPQEPATPVAQLGTPPTCLTCVHWKNPWDDEYGGLIPLDEIPKWGVCQRIDMPRWERGYDYDDEHGGCYPATMPPVVAFVTDGSDYKADLNTHAGFGCVLHTPSDLPGEEVYDWNGRRYVLRASGSGVAAVPSGDDDATREREAPSGPVQQGEA